VGYATSRPAITGVVCGTEDRFWLAAFDPSVPEEVDGMGASWKIVDPSGSVERIVVFPQGFQLAQVVGERAYGTRLLEENAFIEVYDVTPGWLARLRASFR